MIDSVSGAGGVHQALQSLKSATQQDQTAEKLVRAADQQQQQQAASGNGVDADGDHDHDTGDRGGQVDTRA